MTDLTPKPPAAPAALSASLFAALADVPRAVLHGMAQPDWTAQTVALAIKTKLEGAAWHHDKDEDRLAMVRALWDAASQMNHAATHRGGRRYTYGQWLENVLWALAIPMQLSEVLHEAAVSTAASMPTSSPAWPAVDWSADLPYPPPDPVIAPLKDKIEQLEVALQAATTERNAQQVQAARALAEAEKRVESRVTAIVSAVVSARVTAQVSAVVSAQVAARTSDAVKRQLFQTLSWRLTQPLRQGLRLLRRWRGQPTDDAVWALEQRLLSDPSFSTEPNAAALEAISLAALVEVAQQEAVIIAKTEQDWLASQAVGANQAQAITVKAAEVPKEPKEPTSTLQSAHPAWTGHAASDVNEYHRWIAAYDSLPPAHIHSLRQEAAAWLAELQTEGLVAPSFSIVVLTATGQDGAAYRQTARSIEQQCYGLWDLIAVQGGDAAQITPLAPHTSLAPLPPETAQPLTEATELVEPTQPVEPISPKSGQAQWVVDMASALDQAQGDWFICLQAGEVLRPHALLRLAQRLMARPDAGWIYSDDDVLTVDQMDEAKRSDPHFKTAWNLDLFLARPYAGPASAFKKSFLIAGKAVKPSADGIGGAAADAVQVADAAVWRCHWALSLLRLQATPVVLHVPHILAHRTHTWDDMNDLQRQSLGQLFSQHLALTQPQAKLQAEPAGWRVHHPIPAPAPLVSLLIPSKNNHLLLRQCVDSILHHTHYPHYEIILIDNGSTDVTTLDYVRSLIGQPRIRVVREATTFNYSALNNIAATHAHGGVLGLINDDVQVTHPDWLDELVSQVMRPDVGVVGPKLLYPNHTVQHAGVALVGGWARHIHRHLPHADAGYQGRAALVQHISSVTGACLFVRKALWDAVGGLDEVDLPIGWSDIDLCLKVQAQGLRNLFTPHAVLIHHESASRGHDTDPTKQARAEREIRIMHQRWGKALWEDGVGYNPNLTDGAENMGLAWPPRVAVPTTD